jgi:hypothetical protein
LTAGAHNLFIVELLMGYPSERRCAHNSARVIRFVGSIVITFQESARNSN